MPTYVFHCNTCKADFEVFQSLKEYNGHTQCPDCQTETEHRVYDVVPGHVVLGDSEIKIGHLAKRNRDRMPDDQKKDLARKHNEYKFAPVEKDLPKGVKERARKNKNG